MFSRKTVMAGVVGIGLTPWVIPQKVSQGALGRATPPDAQALSSLQPVGPTGCRKPQQAAQVPDEFSAAEHAQGLEAKRNLGCCV